MKHIWAVPDTPIPIENRITIAEDGGIILGDTL